MIILFARENLESLAFVLQKEETFPANVGTVPFCEWLRSSPLEPFETDWEEHDIRSIYC